MECRVVCIPVDVSQAEWLRVDLLTEPMRRGAVVMNHVAKITIVEADLGHGQFRCVGGAIMESSDDDPWLVAVDCFAQVPDHFSWAHSIGLRTLSSSTEAQEQEQALPLHALMAYRLPPDEDGEDTREIFYGFLAHQPLDTPILPHDDLFVAVVCFSG